MSEELTRLSLPLFPLGTVLFPGGSMPLQIFEVRYLDMIGKCHKAGAPFGVVSLTQGDEVRKPVVEKEGATLSVDGFALEAFHTVGTLARIDSFSSPQPGLMVIRCTGMQRFQISRSDRLKHGLWVANVTRILDDQPVAIPDDLKPVASALGNVIKTLQERAVPLDQMPLQPPYQLDDCGWVANRWCEFLPMAPEVKQRLMVLDNPLVRLELVSDLLERSGVAL